VKTYSGPNGSEITALINAKTKVGDKELVIDNLELVDVTRQDGGYRIGTLQVPQQRIEEDDTVVDVSDFSIDGLMLPAEGAPSESGAMMMYQTAKLREVRVWVKDKELFSMNDFRVEVTPPKDGNPMEFSGGAEAFSLSLEGVDDEASRETITAMGYEKLDGYFKLEGSWNPDDGMLSLSQYDVTVNDAGTFGFSFELGGYTSEFLASVRQIQAQMAANTDGDSSAQGMAMLGLMQQLTFHSARIQFLDDSLTGRALAFVAAQQGAKPADIANQAKAVVPFMLMQLNNPELTSMATAAISAFLDDPQNLAITAAPAQPMPFALIMAGAMSAPQALPQQLGVKVLANE
jgi:hypothetical protein